MKSRLLERQYDSGSSILLADNENNYVYFLCEGFAEAYIQNLQGSIARIKTCEHNRHYNLQSLNVTQK